MNFNKPNPLISIKKMQRLNKSEIIDKINEYEKMKNIGGLPPDLYYDKSTLMDILNYHINNRS